MKNKIALVVMVLLIPMVAAAIPKAFCQDHELAVTAITPEPTAVYRGWTMVINVTVENKGTNPEDFNVTAYYNTTLIGMQNVTALPASSSIVLTFDWLTTGVAYSNYTIRANATILAGETNTTDNEGTYETVQVKLMGDANGNGIVDLDDAYLMSIAFGSFPGHSRWNLQADLNQDDFVDLLDFFMFGQNYGKSA
jgi:hypothetical protein